MLCESPPASALPDPAPGGAPAPAPGAPAAAGGGAPRRGAVPFAPTRTQTLVVPPFECAWIAEEGSALAAEGRGCVSFEVKGDNDVTVILKAARGSRRWQHASSTGAGAGGGAAPPPGSPAEGAGVEPNYTVILGSHRNSCLKFEKSGELRAAAPDAPGARLPAAAFARYWVNYEAGAITVGAGAPGARTAAFRWADPDPIPGIRFAGLSAWDKHVGYRNIHVGRALDFSGDDDGAVSDAEGAGGPATGPPRLVDLCAAAAAAALRAESACAALAAAEALAPVAAGLRAAAAAFAARELPAVRAADPAGFAALPPEALAAVLASPVFGCREAEALDAAAAWAAAGGRGRAALEALLPHVRFPLMSDAELAAAAAHPALVCSAALAALVAEAAAARRGAGAAAAGALGAASVRAPRALRPPSPAEAAAAVRLQRRRPRRPAAELVYLHDGDRNGVGWFLGARGGAARRPGGAAAPGGGIAVTASSPAARGCTDPRALLSGAFLRTNFAGPRRGPGGGEPASWWALDLGEGAALECTHYTLRHDGSADFLRSWALQGSADGAAWADLRRHEDDGALCRPGQYASWPVGGPAAAAAFRRFRVLLLRPNAAAPNPRHVSLSWIELYGNLYLADTRGEGGAAAAEAGPLPP